MKYFGIKTPGRTAEPSYIWWITNCTHDSWMSFFTYPNREGDRNGHRAPIAEAVKAYEAIGYKCVELEVTEKAENWDSKKHGTGPLTGDY